MANRLKKDGTNRWVAFNSQNKYAGRIEKDQYGVWNHYDSKGNRTQMYGYKEARAELRDYTK